MVPTRLECDGWIGYWVTVDQTGCIVVWFSWISWPLSTGGLDCHVSRFQGLETYHLSPFQGGMTGMLITHYQEPILVFIPLVCLVFKNGIIFRHSQKFTCCLLWDKIFVSTPGSNVCLLSKCLAYILALQDHNTCSSSGEWRKKWNTTLKLMKLLACVVLETFLWPVGTESKKIPTGRGKMLYNVTKCSCQEWSS
jgi:hypothetical protein